jgi:hypothetical protein
MEIDVLEMWEHINSKTFAREYAMGNHINTHMGGHQAISEQWGCAT